MNTLTWVVAGFTALLLLLTLLPISRHKAWWVRGADFPRLQLAALAMILLVLQFALLEFSRSSTWWIVITTFACLLYQAWWIAPNTPLYPKETKTAGPGDNRNSIRIMSVNVLTSNPHIEKLLNLVRQHEPDVLIAVETDLRWQAGLDTLQADFPFSIKCPLDNLYGMHLYSRLPLHDAAIQYLIEEDVPSFHTAVELRCGQLIKLHCLHPAPPSPVENSESTERDAELIIVAKAVKDSELPVIVAGDLNDVAWSATTRLFRKISGLLDPRIGRGMFNTFHAQHLLMRWPLDHLFHSDHFAVRHIQRLAEFGSDHFPILVDLLYVPRLENEQEGLQANKSDHKLAHEHAAEADANKNDVHQPGQ